MAPPGSSCGDGTDGTDGAGRGAGLGFGGLQHPGPAAAGTGTDDGEGGLSGASVSRHVLAPTGGRNMEKPEGWLGSTRWFFLVEDIEILSYTHNVYV